MVYTDFANGPKHNSMKNVSSKLNEIAVVKSIAITINTSILLSMYNFLRCDLTHAIKVY